MQRLGDRKIDEVDACDNEDKCRETRQDVRVYQIASVNHAIVRPWGRKMYVCECLKQQGDLYFGALPFDGFFKLFLCVRVEYLLHLVFDCLYVGPGRKEEEGVQASAQPVRIVVVLLAVLHGEKHAGLDR